VSVCPTCHTPLQPNARFCPKDGTTIRADSILQEAQGAEGELVPVLSSGFGSGSGPGPVLGSGPSRETAGTAATVAAKTRPRNPTATDLPSEDPLIGRTLDGRFHIRARLGQGGVGAVYEGEHVQIKKRVAVKVLHTVLVTTEEFRKRFEREARAASKLSHPACVQVLDFGRVEKVEPAEDAPQLIGMPYLVMEFVRGTVLLDRLLDGPRITPTDAVTITRDVLGALKHAHQYGIVHRDLKPANIMLLDGDVTGTHVKLLDFGLAKDLGPEADSKDALTQAGMVFGTPGYLSPEQAAGKTLDARTDLYSLGVVLFEMACNRRLFERDDPLDAVRAHLNTPPPDPRSVNPDISPGLAAVMLRALAKDPAARFADAEAFNLALLGCPESGAVLPVARKPAAAPAWLRSFRVPARLQAFGARKLAIAAGVALLVLLAGAVVLSRSRPAPAAMPAPVVVAPPSSSGELTQSAMRHLELAVSYRRKLWCSDAIEELERALRDSPALKHDPEVARHAVACLGPKTYDKASRFLVEKLGADAVPALSAAAAEASPELRKNAERTLARISH
jgi:tRNA A-37 threonylcarbamoyl transferase component Bud32